MRRQQEFLTGQEFYPSNSNYDSNSKRLMMAHTGKSFNNGSLDISRNNYYADEPQRLRQQRSQIMQNLNYSYSQPYASNNYVETQSVKSKVSPRLDNSMTLPNKSIYDLVKQDIKMPEGLLFRGKYVGKRQTNQAFSIAPNSATSKPQKDDVASVVYSAYGSKAQARYTQATHKRPQTAAKGDKVQLVSSQKRLKTPNTSKQQRTKIYMPDDYLKHVGYKYFPNG